MQPAEPGRPARRGRLRGGPFSERAQGMVKGGTVLEV
jgi:hypothetical protein